MLRRLLVVLIAALPGAAPADDRLVHVHAPEPLVQAGLLDYILPRFSLKTQVKVVTTAEPEADMVLGDAGRPVFTGLGRSWHMDIRSPDHPGTRRLADWLLSDIGQRTVASFAPDGEVLFGPPQSAPVAVAEVSPDGDAAAGLRVSREKCTRCHAVDADTRGAGIGSAPSFGVLRALPDWEGRFSAFFVLNPHPAFTQVKEVTPPFPIDRPSPIAPVVLDLDELDALLAYVANMQAADLGAPLEHQ